MSMDDNKLPRGCRLVHVPVATDSRGSLAFATACREIPFPVARVFWIYDVPEGQRRGGHAHRECHEVVFAARGAVTMLVDDGATRASVRLLSPSTGLFVGAGVWCELSDFQEGTVLLALASHPYDASGYVHDYDQYKREASR